MANLHKGRLPELKQNNLCLTFVCLLLLAIFLKIIIDDVVVYFEQTSVYQVSEEFVAEFWLLILLYQIHDWSL